MVDSANFKRILTWPHWPNVILDGPLTHYRRDHIVYLQGETIRDISLLQSGVVRVSVADGSHDVCVALRTPGWLIGAAGAVTGYRYLATVRTMSDCLVHRISISDFHHERHKNTDFASALQRMFASELRWQHDRAARIGTRRHRGALEHLLYELFAAAGAPRPDGSVWLAMGLSVTDIATMIGVTRQWATVLLAELMSSGTITRSKGRFCS
jgi:CRP-like cAMP-binding protein